MLLPPKGLPELTLGYDVANWIEDHCAIPDGDQAGDPFILTPEQLRFILWYYAINKKGQFLFRRALLVRPQKWGKGPLSAAIACAEAAGPVLFDYMEGDVAVGRAWSTPWIQVTAVSEDQTDNVWTALLPMIQLGDMTAEIPDTGITRINLPGGGRIEPVTAAAISRLGQRITFVIQDEPHSWLPSNGGVKLADTQRRNLAGMGGRSLGTTNAWDPGENSVAQQTFELNLQDVLIDYPTPAKGSFKNKRDRGRILKKAYAGAPWVSLDRIEAECLELLPRDPGQAERFFGNRIVAGADKAFDVELFKGLALGEQRIEPGRLIVLGFDGARRRDTTALIATDVELGFQQLIGFWKRPADASPDDWEVDADDVNQTVEDAFETYDVWRLYADPPYWSTEVDHWAGRWGEDRVWNWWTNRRKAMAYATKAWITDMESGELSHDGDPSFIEHVGNTVKRMTRMRDEDDGSFLWYPSKESADSPNKIDIVMAAILSWEARGDAIKKGAENKSQDTIASW